MIPDYDTSGWGTSNKSQSSRPHGKACRNLINPCILIITREHQRIAILNRSSVYAELLPICP